MFNFKETLVLKQTLTSEYYLSSTDGLTRAGEATSAGLWFAGYMLLPPRPAGCFVHGPLAITVQALKLYQDRRLSITGG